MSFTGTCVIHWFCTILHTRPYALCLYQQLLASLYTHVQCTQEVWLRNRIHWQYVYCTGAYWYVWCVLGAVKGRIHCTM